LRPATALCYDVVSGAMQRKVIPPDVALPGDGLAQALLVAPVLIQGALRGRAIVMRETRRKFTRDDLEFLLLLVGQAAAGFEGVRLQAKAEEVAVLEERARIARDLHDGFIQSLAGIDLRVEACKLLLQRDPARVPRELEDLHQAVDRGYREVRHYLAVLRGSGTEGHDLCATLDRLAAEFSLRERLQVHLARPPVDPALPPATSYELTQIVREALRNAVRHGHATRAVVKLATGPAHISLVVRDNGCGFRNGNGTIDADGFLARAAGRSLTGRPGAIGHGVPGRRSEEGMTLTSRKRRIVIVDDHTLFREGLRTILEMEDDIEVVADVESAEDVVELVWQTRPDVLLLDIRMPQGNGLDAIPAVLRISPGTQVLVLTACDEKEEHVRA